MGACHNGHTDVVKLLLEHSNGHIKLNAKNGHGWTPFNRACQNGHTDVVKFLLEHFDRNVDLNTRHTNGFNAIMFACSNGHTDVVQLLLDHSKDRNIVVEIPNPRDFGGLFTKMLDKCSCIILDIHQNHNFWFRCTEKIFEGDFDIQNKAEIL